MMDATALLANLRAAGIKVVPRSDGNLYLAPRERLDPALVERVREHKEAILAYLRTVQADAEIDRLAAADASDDPRECELFEATFVAGADGSPAVSFPPCPVCGETRYWLASDGRVLCGSKRCASAQRFRLIALEYRAVQ